MEFVLLGLLILAFPFIAIVALVKTVNLNDRMRRLERRIVELEGRSLAPATAPHSAAGSVPESTAQAAAEAAVTPPPAEPQPEPAPVAPQMPPATPTPPASDSGGASFEERFGTRWVVWTGGLALALGGIFLVRYSIEAGLIGPGLRLFSGALLAGALVAAGEWARRNEQLSGIAGVPSAHIPGILTAAGTTVAYAVVYAAYALYGFVGPGGAFVLLGIVALATLAAALLHGPALAALGLVGAYVTPLLVSSSAPNFWALYIYIAVVTAAAFALANARRWRWLALTALAFGVFWSLPGLDLARTDGPAAHLFHAVAGFALAAALIVSGFLYGPPGTPGRVERLSSVALSAYLLCSFLVVLGGGHQTLALAVFVLLVAATLAVAWRAESATAAVPFAALLSALAILRWAFDGQIAGLIAHSGASGAPEPLLVSTGPHVVTAAALAVLFCGAGYLAQGRSAAALAPILWSAAGVAGPLLILIAVYARLSGLEASVPFAGLALLLAAAFAVATETLCKREPRPGLATAGALYAVGAVSALALTLTFALERGWLTVALALMTPGIAWVALHRPLPMLRWLAAAMAIIVTVRIGMEPRIVGDDVGTTPIFNWILYGYGVPALSFWIAGHLMRGRADDPPARTVDSAAILFSVLLAFLEIRHLMTGGDIYSEESALAEVGLQVCAGLAMAIGLEHLRHRTHSIVHDIGALAIAGLTLWGIVVGLGIAANPLVTDEPVGGAVLNTLLLGYGLPAVLAIVLALRTRGLRPHWYRICAAVAAVVLMLTYLTLQVTRLYRGPVLTEGVIGDAETYTYSVVWLAYGVALLLFGIWTASQPARLASAAIVILTVAKVFLIDMADLTGVWRALSFIGLGLVLVGIGWLYQRLLFPPRRAPSPPPAAAK
jgi:uncharacterized membrane protein